MLSKPKDRPQVSTTTSHGVTNSPSTARISRSQSQQRRLTKSDTDHDPELPTSGSSAQRKIAKLATIPATVPGSIPKTSESNPKRLDFQLKHRAASDIVRTRGKGPRSAPLRVTFSDKAFGHSPEQPGVGRKSWTGSTSANSAGSGQEDGQGNGQELTRGMTHPELEPSSSIATFCQGTLNTVLSWASSFQDLWRKIQPFLAWGLVTFLFFLACLLLAAAWLQWVYTWTPGFLQKPLRAWTDLGSRMICSLPGTGTICPLMCRWDDYPDIFPTVCQGQHTTADSSSFDDIFREMYGDFSQSLGLNSGMYSAPKKLKDHRNAMFLHLDQIKEIHGTGKVKNVDFPKLETKTQTILDLMLNVPEDLFVFINHVNVVPDTVLYQTGATKVVIEAILRNQSTTYHSSNGSRRNITPQALLRKRFLAHMREWKFMVERLIEPGKSLKMRFNMLEDECLSLRGLIKTAIAELMDQKDSTMGSWPLWKRLGVRLGIYKPPELRNLLNALDEVEDLYTVVKDLSNLFEDL